MLFKLHVPTDNILSVSTSEPNNLQGSNAACRLHTQGCVCCGFRDETPGSDSWAVHHGWVSVTPLSLKSDITAGQVSYSQLLCMLLQLLQRSFYLHTVMKAACVRVGAAGSLQ